MRSIIIALLCSLSISLGLVAQGPVTHAIFDLGEVLVKTDKRAAFKEVGYTPFIQYALANITRIFVLKKMIYDELLFPFLTSVEERNPNQVAARDPEGRLLPQIMCTHFKGGITDEQVRTNIDAALKALAYLNHIETTMIRALTSMMFTPERFIKTQYIVPEGKAFVQECVARGLKPCIHSTWARESFELLKQQDPDFFNLFEDRIFISGHTGFMKPDPASYTHITNTLGIPASACTFFDDRPENISVARACGMQAHLITPAFSWLQPWKHVPDFDAACAYLTALNSPINAVPGIAL
ncbi:MAG: HAD-IA family hydrolase [Candidatus Babeliales bacterium]